MNEDDWSPEIGFLQKSGTTLAPGLSEKEILAVERTNQFRFPVDLRSFLMAALPCSADFPDWRTLDRLQVSEWMNSPYEGIAFDIENNDFWWAPWGARPARMGDALAVARAALDRAPRLIPIYGHRFMPAEPADAGNPVFSVHQTDIIYYGLDLRRYFAREFGGLDHNAAVSGEARVISFWTDLAEGG